MKVTNRLGLPQPIVEVLSRDNYSKGDADFSVTELIDSPRQKALTNRHRDEITVDCIDLIYQFDGKAVHSILEGAEVSPDVGIIEERLSVEVGLYTVSGAIDYYDVKRGVIQDYKRVSTWEVVMGIKEERYRQLNLYAHLARANGWVVNGLEIVYLFRDWSEARANREPDYPPDRAMRVDIPMWTPEATEQYLKDRVKAHVATRILADDDLPDCTAEEMWLDETVYAVMRNGRKSAVRATNDKGVKFKSRGEAQRWIQSNAQNDSSLYIEQRLGEPRRCLKFCNVANFCNQWGG
jgi:hypothetical protein|tara:strand:+ start:991 stop:1872 length:882 start_codon:yes stop_codon:yes gene_type:complete